MEDKTFDEIMEQISMGPKLTFHRPDPYSAESGGREGEEVRAKYAQGLSHTELKALECIASNGFVTNKQVAEAIGLSVSRSLKLLRRLTEKGIVSRHGESTATGAAAAHGRPLLVQRPPCERARGQRRLTKRV